MPAAVDAKRALVETEHPHLSISRRCELLGLNRSTFYLAPATESEENLRLMRLIDESDVSELESGLTAYFRLYDEERPHQSLAYMTPGEVYRAGGQVRIARGRP